MAIKAVFFDLDGTLVEEGSSAPASGVPEMLGALRALGLRIVVGSNRGQYNLESRLRQAGLQIDLAVANDLIGADKPSPLFCNYAAKRLGILSHEMLYVGDDNRTDAICAINAGVLYANAQWSNPSPRYGVKLNKPEDTVRFVRAFLLKKAVWYWSLDDADASGNPVRARAIVTGKRDWDTTIRKAVLRVLKDDEEVKLPGIPFSRFLLLHFLTSIYLDGLHQEIKLWTLYPPSRGGSHRKIVNDFIEPATKLFKAKYGGDLLIRHRPSIKAAFSRASGRGDPGFLNQMNTVHLNPEYKGQLKGKHVLVVDDYSTRGHSFECARHLLLQGGAAKVTAVSIGRYGSSHEIQSARGGLVWDPWSPHEFAKGDFTAITHHGTLNTEALREFRDSLRPFQ